MQRVLTEAIGTFFLAFVVIGTFTHGSPLAAFAVGGIVAVIVYAGAGISGGHFNPAVSVGAFLQGRLAAADLPAYVGAQLAGASVASLLGSWVFRTGTNPGAAWSGRGLVTAMIVEAIFTFLLVFVALTVIPAVIPADGNAPQAHHGIAIGAVVAVGLLTIGGFSGAAFNPAVAMGMTFAQLSAWGNLWAYAAAQLLGGVLGSLAVKALNPTTTASGA